jgi:hypothetical protein
MSTDVLIEKYIQLRDKKAQMKQEFDSKVANIDEAMKKIEAHMMKVLDEAGADRIGGATGVAFKSTVNSATVADKDAFRKFVQDSDRWELADLRAAKTAVKEYIDEVEDLPPGINWRTETVVRINRP